MQAKLHTWMLNESENEMMYAKLQSRIVNYTREA